MIARFKAALNWVENAIARIPFLRFWFLIILAVLVTVTVWPWVQTLPLRPITTRGQIFVESPEVYTRERLVNDRYGQAFWLEQQLQKLDAAKNFTSVRRDLALKLAFQPSSEEKLPPLAELSSPPFEHEFQIRSALRDRIRQSLLENQLDDRHDLTGNSVYGLKFDTSVIPGTNTRTRAFVRVRVKPPKLPDPSRLPELLRYSLEDLSQQTENPFSDFPVHYDNWISNIEWRLNSYLSDIPDWACQTAPINPVEKSTTRAVLKEALVKVLAIDKNSLVVPANLFPDLTDEGRASYGVTGAIELPEPWKSYLQISLAHNETCWNWKQFVVEPLTQILALAPAEEIDALRRADRAKNAEPPLQGFETNFFQMARQKLPARDTGDALPDPQTTQAPGTPPLAPDAPTEEALTEYAVYVARQNPTGSPWVSREEFERLSLKITLNAETGREILANKSGFEQCISPPGTAPGPECAASAWFTAVQVGMYNLARDILSSDFYLYTVFPRSDVSGLLERSMLSSSAGLEGLGGPAGGLSSSVSEVASKLIPSQISFSDAENQDEIVFGWVIGSGGVQQPVQKSQFVLLSLPAYLPKLELQVETGWLDRNSDFHAKPGGSPVPMSVALPPDYEAFDTLISGVKRYGPAIFDRRMEKVRVEACAPASVLIPGARLWRSSLVTLAGQPADQIIVMPNMRGIIAKFERIPALVTGTRTRTIGPAQAGEGQQTVSEPNRQPATLQVWTSEGSDRIDNKVIVVASDARCEALVKADQ